MLAYLPDGGGKCCHQHVNLACADESEKKIYCVPTPNIVRKYTQYLMLRIFNKKKRQETIKRKYTAHFSQCCKMCISILTLHYIVIIGLL